MAGMRTPAVGSTALWRRSPLPDSRPHGPFTAEVAGRVGLAFTGAMYDPQERGCNTSNPGRDSFAVSLSTGVSLEK
jgi:hypothetical protein